MIVINERWGANMASIGAYLTLSQSQNMTNKKVKVDLDSHKNHNKWRLALALDQ